MKAFSRRTWVVDVAWETAVAFVRVLGSLVLVAVALLRECLFAMHEHRRYAWETAAAFVRVLGPLVPVEVALVRGFWLS